MKTNQTSLSHQKDVKPLNKKNYQPQHKHGTTGRHQNQSFILPWQTPLGFEDQKKKRAPSRDIQKPKICNHYF